MILCEIYPVSLTLSNNIKISKVKPFYLSVASGDSPQPEETNVQGADTVATVENVDAIRKYKYDNKTKHYFFRKHPLFICG
jgi:hypothetical protein